MSSAAWTGGQTCGCGARSIKPLWANASSRHGPPYVKSKDEREMHKGKMWVLFFKDMLETSWLDRVPSPCASAERSVDEGAHSGKKTEVSDHGGR